MSVSHVAPSYDAYWQAKRRKVRKGTHSCWECKRRKMKCIFDPRIASASCIGCRRRGSPCISQEFPEDLADVPMRVETSISDGTPSDGRARAPMPSERTDPSVLTPLSADVQSSRHHQSPEARLF
ncbi:hypothetical protein HFD88_009868 [Aspergillus terreus]|nr:hypothetical protein HFD88_009868 [Aspergillus terreus]